MDIYQFASDGVISTPELGRLGLGPNEIRRALRAGRLRRLIRGWYAVWPPDLPVAPWDGANGRAREQNQHRLLVRALVRQLDGRVVASHQSALLLHGAPLYALDLSRAQLTRTQDDHSRHRALAHIHPAVDFPTSTSPDGVPCVHPAVAAVQVGLGPGEQAVGVMPSLVAADWLLQTRAISMLDLSAAIGLFASCPGITAVRAQLACADGRHESVGETRLAAILRALGLRFRPQVAHVVDGQRTRVDFELDGERVIIEFDGLGKYRVDAADGQDEGLAMRRAFAAEKRRQDALTALGYEFVRVLWSDLDRPWFIAAKIQAARALAQQRTGA